jgi:hypothetical protein
VFERFTDRARRVLVLAQVEARLLNHSFIGTEHILLGLIQEGEGVAAKALESLDVSLEAVREQVQETIGPASAQSETGSPPFTPRSKRVLELSLREALQLGHNYIGTEHLLLGLLAEGEGVAANVLQALGADLHRVRQEVLGLLSGKAPGERLEEWVFPPRGPIPISHFDWPVYPTKVLTGPVTHLASAETELRIIGLLLFESGIEVKWEMANVVEISEHYVPYITLGDDVETTYRPVKLQRAPRPVSAWVGRTFFMPAVPDEATLLRFTWTAESLEFEL